MRKGAGFFIITFFPLSASGCLYVSDYVPPKDGRARLIWRDNGPVAYLAGGTLNDDQCPGAVANLARVEHVNFYREQRYPKRAGYHYQDWITVARRNFLEPQMVYRIRPADEGIYWKPVFYGFALQPATEDFDFWWRPVFDYQLWKNLKGREWALEPDELNLWQTLLQFNTASSVGRFSDESVGYRDSLAAEVFHLGINVASLIMIPFVGITALYPLGFSSTSAVKMNYASNLVNAYNDLARSNGSPCAHTRPPQSDDSGATPSGL